MDQSDDVETIVDGIAVAEFLVAAVALVFRGAKNVDLECGMRLLIAQTIHESLISRRVVDDQDLDAVLMERGGNAAEHFLDRRFRVVSDNEDQDAVATQIEQWNEAHASYLKLKAGHVSSEEALILCAVLARRTTLAEHRVSRGEHGSVVVVAEATEEVPRFAERAPNEEVSGKVVGCVPAVAAVG